MSLRESLFQNEDFSFRNHLFYQNQVPRNTAFEETYLKIRANENRIYTDEQVKNLPEIEYTHPLKKEWLSRKKSLRRLMNHFRQARTHSVLEIGCGNGWLAHHLALVPDAEVLGVDVNETELLQAAQVFKRLGNLTFAYADIQSKPTLPVFDAIVLASSIQYFANVSTLLEILIPLLSRNGAIHILDSPIYEDGEADVAKNRSEKYFAHHESGMQRFYHHHSWSALKAFRYELMYNPVSFGTRIKKVLSPDSPFPWIRITR